MKLYELKPLMDMLNPNCEVTVTPPSTGVNPIGFSAPKDNTESEMDAVKGMLK